MHRGIDGDVPDTDPHELINLPINTTVLGGTVVYRRDTDATAPSFTKATPAYHQRGTACLAGGNCCCLSNA
ncbi:MAG: hypothetical protein ACRDOO_12985 [Actinomadura sp.]